VGVILWAGAGGAGGRPERCERETGVRLRGFAGRKSQVVREKRRVEV